MSRRAPLAVVLVAVAAAAGLGAWLAVRGGPEADDARASEAAREGAPERAASGLRGTGTGAEAEKKEGEPGVGRAAGEAPAGGPPSAPLTIRGVVVDDLGRPIPRATVHVGAEEGSAPRVEADAEGKFELAVSRERWEAAHRNVCASTPGRIPFCAQPDDPSEPVRIVVRRTFRGTLRVRLTGEPPADGTAVRLTLSEDGVTYDGKYVAPLGLDGVVADRGVVQEFSAVWWWLTGLRPHTMTVQAEEHVGGPVAVHFEEETGETTVDVPMRRRPTGFVEGVLLGRDGKPVAGTEVQLWMDAWEVGGPEGHAITDEAGRFRYEHLRPGTTVRLTTSGTGPATEVVVPASGVIVRIPSKARIHGRVSRPAAEGRPPVAVAIAAEDPGANLSYAGSSGLADGTFDYQVDAGAWEVWATDGPLEGPRQRVVLGHGEGKQLVVESPPVAPTVRGRVLRADGSPASNVTVMARDERDDDLTDYVDAGEDGAFVLRVVPEHAVRVEASSGIEQRGEARGVRPGTTGVVIRMSPTVSIAGRVAEGARRLGTDADVVARRRGEARTSGYAALRDDGTFELPGLAPEVYELVARVGTRVTWPPFRVDAATKRADVVLPLVDGGAIEVEVRDADGTPKPHVGVQAGGPSFAWSVDAWTDEKGRARIGGLVPGRWRVSTRPFGWRETVETTVDVALGPAAKVVLEGAR